MMDGIDRIDIPQTILHVFDRTIPSDTIIPVDTILSLTTVSNYVKEPTEFYVLRFIAMKSERY